jgi:hypothetical protein
MGIKNLNNPAHSDYITWMVLGDPMYFAGNLVASDA